MVGELVFCVIAAGRRAKQKKKKLEVTLPRDCLSRYAVTARGFLLSTIVHTQYVLNHCYVAVEVA